GTQRTGDFVENRHEGYPGYSIDQIANDTQPRLMNTIMELPNVVLLHAGTNDMVERIEAHPSEAPERLGKLMDMVLEAVPNVTLIVAQIIQVTEESERRTLIPQFNAQILRIAAERVAKGFRVQVADLSTIGVIAADLRDGLHPSDAGYRKMAVKWFEALQNASRAGLISPPRALSSGNRKLVEV
ncbi:carbohydrate esterase family 3 protein, partial [Cercospora zeae-maydis SCOH1-5]